MRLIELFAEDREEKFCALAVDALTNWSASETNKGVLATVLLGLGSYAGPHAEAALLAHADHHDADVRRAVAASLGTSRDTPGLPAEAQEALLTLMGDPDQTCGSMPVGVPARKDRAIPRCRRHGGTPRAPGTPGSAGCRIRSRPPRRRTVRGSGRPSEPSAARLPQQGTRLPRGCVALLMAP
ncbi:HEAT repeat domain-containing protein [Streptomyces zhihengii]|uniref:HEAT repeat domain-containing protein n=1 Tax=Streptomyces zhihengii TaxID=1818004 RepID=UPI0036429AFA